MIITIEHVRAAGLCGKGAVHRLKRLGLTNQEITEALQNGMTEERIRSFGDAQMELAIAAAYRMAAEKNNG